MRLSQKLLRGLAEADRQKLAAILRAAGESVMLPGRARQAILRDVEALYAYLLGTGLSLDEAARRIGPDLLGDFYRPPGSIQWYSLGSASKIYPLSMAAGNIPVFRVSAYLREPVAPEALQCALLSAVKRFPAFAAAVRKGFFWHYIEAIRTRFACAPERTMPCQPLRAGGGQTPAFRVGYYGRRISLETFYILTDEAGAMAFLHELVREYLRLIGEELPPEARAPLPDEQGLSGEGGAPLDAGAALAGEMRRPGDVAALTSQLTVPAGQIAGRRMLRQPAKVLHVRLVASMLLAKANARGTTVTGLLAALVCLAAGDAIGRPLASSRVVVQVPASYCKYDPGQALRNNSMYRAVCLPYSALTALEDILPAVDQQLREGETRERLDQVALAAQALVEHPVIHYAPLHAKRAAFRLVHGLVGERAITVTFRDMGAVADAYGGRVESLDYVPGPSGVSRVGCGLVRFGEHAMLTITKTVRAGQFEESMVSRLAALGLDMQLEEVSL